MNKRLFDVTFSFLGLLLLTPLIVIVAGMILLSDSPPMIFRQIRVGRNGNNFILYKFRTMNNAQEGLQGSFDVGNQSRVTRIGALLRKTKLDELPQLWNVIKGDMSLVGPRPEVRKWVDVYPERWKKILTVRPGITDPASIRYRNEEKLLAQADDPVRYYRDHILIHKLALYEEYVKTRSFCGDIYLIYKTIFSVICPNRFSCHN